MASWQVQQLAAGLAESSEFRVSFRRDPEAAVAARGFELTEAERRALRSVDWHQMNDDELLVRLRGAAHRGTHQTA